ncbi:winged helix-turn-helix domain-containing protein [Changchengzhania lutea]|uniref:winged helix-turn-helix domain-containing protein n=1 Tax=Changchengzhania lutea TaxID=2049305 RepID=UPI001FEAF8B1|nr:winged helix-turn-helix domain-containing protein [Changchengzhania lutea]
MGLKLFKIVINILVGILLNVPSSYAQNPSSDNDVEVSLRMIGHQVLLSANDSTSCVLPITKGNGRYRIQFEAEFEFNPDELVTTIDRVVKSTKMAQHYIVEVEGCDTKDIIYSFEVNALEQSDIIPCRGREQPKSCYSILFTLIEPISTNTLGSLNTVFYSLKYFGGVIGLALITLAFFFIRKRKHRRATDSNLIPLGEYQFDKLNTELLIEEQRIELTGKEGDLLLLLYNAANTTVEREVILNKVWGDEGDYVGRTLDMFISKLRKKLEFDSKVKIVNIRGVGYKLVVNV